MAERYQEWFSLPADLYVDGSPIFIKSGIMFYDTFKDAFFVKLCLKNASPRMIKRVEVGLVPLDMSNRALTPDQPYVYANLFAGSGAEFGKLVEIPISGGNAIHSFSVYVSMIVFDDGSVWTSEDRRWLSYSEHEKAVADRLAAEAAEAEAARERAERRAEKDAKRAAENEERRARFMEEYKAWSDMISQTPHTSNETTQGASFGTMQQPAFAPMQGAYVPAQKEPERRRSGVRIAAAVMSFVVATLFLFLPLTYFGLHFYGMAMLIDLAWMLTISVAFILAGIFFLKRRAGKYYCAPFIVFASAELLINSVGILNWIDMISNYGIEYYGDYVIKFFAVSSIEVIASVMMVVVVILAASRGRRAAKVLLYFPPALYLSVVPFSGGIMSVIVYPLLAVTLLLLGLGATFPYKKIKQ